MSQKAKKKNAVNYDTAYDRARLARHVYKKASHKNQDSGDWDELATSDDFGLPKYSTGFKGSVYRRTNAETGKTEHAIVYSGMDGIEDLSDAITLAVIGFPKQFYDAYVFARQVSETYDIDLKETDFVGHSMGGYLAQAVGLACGAPKMWMFNSPSMRTKDIETIGQQLLETLGQEMDIDLADMRFDQLDERIVSFRTKNDLVARVGQSPATVLESGLEMRPHSIETLERLLLEEAHDNRNGDKKRIFNKKSFQINMVRKFFDDLDIVVNLSSSLRKEDKPVPPNAQKGRRTGPKKGLGPHQ